MKLETSLKLLPISFLLSPALLLPQMPPQPGRLTISSNPAGAIVSINGRQVAQRTNATFVVSPGNYRVSVASQDWKLNCPEITVTVEGGRTAARNCTANVWK